MSEAYLVQHFPTDALVPFLQEDLSEVTKTLSNYATASSPEKLCSFPITTRQFNMNLTVCNNTSSASSSLHGFSRSIALGTTIIQAGQTVTIGTGWGSCINSMGTNSHTWTLLMKTDGLYAYDTVTGTTTNRWVEPQIQLQFSGICFSKRVG